MRRIVISAHRNVRVGPYTIRVAGMDATNGTVELVVTADQAVNLEGIGDQRRVSRNSGRRIAVGWRGRGDAGPAPEAQQP